MTEIATWDEMCREADANARRDERRLLAQLSLSLYLQDHGRINAAEVDQARTALINFYREIGMHP